MIGLDQAVGDGLAGGDDLVEWLEKKGLVAAERIETSAPGKTVAGQLQHIAGDIVHAPAADHGSKPLGRHIIAQGLTLGLGPALDQLPGLIKRSLVIEQADPERG